MGAHRCGGAAPRRGLPGMLRCCVRVPDMLDPGKCMRVEGHQLAGFDLLVTASVLRDRGHPVADPTLYPRVPVHQPRRVAGFASQGNRLDACSYFKQGAIHATPSLDPRGELEN